MDRHPQRPGLDLFIVAILTLIGFFGPLSAVAEQLQGKVVGVSDGDTITLLDAELRQHRIRLSGIDAPERGQPFGSAAKQRLAALVFGQMLTADCYKHDQYGRDVCRIFVGDTDVQLEQLRAGYAWHYNRYAKEQTPDERAAYGAAEIAAKKEQRGLWVDRNPIPPWGWRAARREQ